VWEFGKESRKGETSRRGTMRRVTKKNGCMGGFPEGGCDRWQKSNRTVLLIWYLGGMEA